MKVRSLIYFIVLLLSVSGSAFAAKRRFNLEMPHPRAPEAINVEEVPPPDPPQTHVFCAADLPCTTTANNTHTGVETFSGTIVVGGGTPQTETQGTDTKLMTAGAISGTGSPLCTDANGGSTTFSCPNIVTSVTGTANQIDVASGTTAPVISLDPAIQLPGSLTAGNGASITISGTGTNNANNINGATVPASATVAATNSSNQIIAAALASADIWVGNGSNLPVAVAISGDSTMTNAGVMTNIGLNGTLLSGLSSGILYNTTSTGVPSIASAAQILSACTGCAPIASPTFTGTATTPALALNGSAPTITATGTTPYINASGPLIQTQQCSFALTTSTLTLALSPVNLCTITLPNAAVVWRVNCQGGWSVTAGTTPTFAVGNNWAQTPSGVFGAASIDTSNAGVGVQGTTSSTSNGNIVATGSLTTAATIYTASWWTTFTGSATSGAYHPTASLTGTSATGTLVGFCTIQ